jgi:acyl dehydratase
MHVDIDAAKSLNFDDVYGHGMLSMAMLGRAVTHWAPQSSLLNFSTRFTALAHVGDVLTCRARVKHVEAGVAELELTVADQTGEVKLNGAARIKVDG